MKETNIEAKWENELKTSIPILMGDLDISEEEAKILLLDFLENF